jgi:hypothetical protein
LFTYQQPAGHYACYGHLKGAAVQRPADGEESGRKIVMLERRVEVRVRDGVTVTMLYPPNDVLRERAAKNESAAGPRVSAAEFRRLCSDRILLGDGRS